MAGRAARASLQHLQEASPAGRAASGACVRHGRRRGLAGTGRESPHAEDMASFMGLPRPGQPAWGRSAARLEGWPGWQGREERLLAVW